jgi:hypothetical protein
MTLVPGGAFIMGKSDDDLADIQDAPTKTVTVRSFIWMKQKSLTVSTEICRMGKRFNYAYALSNTG